MEASVAFEISLGFQIVMHVTEAASYGYVI